MPEICRFLGISILMYFNEHNPPHFHVRYNEYRAVIGIHDLMLREGELPGRVMGLVLEWANLHRQELLENWDSIRSEGVFHKIDPLV
jgi:hypothetical protein